jgi:hypothetical protein
MDRRAFVGGLAGLLSGTVAGCASEGEVPETAPSPPPAVREATPETETAVDDANTDSGSSGEITTNVPVDDPEGANSVVLQSQDVFADDDGDLVVTVGVQNNGPTQTTALVRLNLRTESDELELEQFVELRPGADTLVRFTPDVARDAFEGMSVEILSETPATPLPTDTPTPSGTPSPTDTPTPSDTVSDRGP